MRGLHGSKHFGSEREVGLTFAQRYHEHGEECNDAADDQWDLDCMSLSTATMQMAFAYRGTDSINQYTCGCRRQEEYERTERADPRYIERRLARHQLLVVLCKSTLACTIVDRAMTMSIS